jgi:hypothetical protein
MISRAPHEWCACKYPPIYQQPAAGQQALKMGFVVGAPLVVAARDAQDGDGSAIGNGGLEVSATPSMATVMLDGKPLANPFDGELPIDTTPAAGGSAAAGQDHL